MFSIHYKVKFDTYRNEVVEDFNQTFQGRWSGMQMKRKLANKHNVDAREIVICNIIPSTSTTDVIFTND